MMLPEEYVSKCLQIATEALKKIAGSQYRAGPDCKTPMVFAVEMRLLAEQALNEMRKWGPVLTFQIILGAILLILLLPFAMLLSWIEERRK